MQLAKRSIDPKLSNSQVTLLEYFNILRYRLKEVHASAKNHKAGASVTPYRLFFILAPTKAAWWSASSAWPTTSERQLNPLVQQQKLRQLKQRLLQQRLPLGGYHLKIYIFIVLKTYSRRACVELEPRTSLSIFYPTNKKEKNRNICYSSFNSWEQTGRQHLFFFYRNPAL